jgi:cysteine desulfurase
MGALVLGGPSVIEPLWAGGGQEGARRSGTENLAGAIGFGAAAELAERERARTEEHLTLMRRRFLERLAEEPGHMQPLHDPSAGAASLPSIVVVRVRCAPAAVVLHHLEERGVLVSAGAACHSNKAGVSPALTAFGLSEDQARHVMRFSFARTTTLAEVERALAVAFEVCSALERQHA